MRVKASIETHTHRTQSLQVHRDQLYYVSDEYVGELYRMSLSCSGEGLPQNGCLFFKVIGQTNVNESKTIHNNVYRCD